MKKWILAILFTLLPSLAGAQTSMTGITCPGSGCVVYDVTAQGTLGFQLTGTWVGTVVFEATVNGTTWVTWTVTNASNTSVTSTIANGIFTGDVNGYLQVRARFSLHWSGTATVTDNFTPAGSGGGGNVDARYVLNVIDEASDLTNAQILSSLSTGIVKVTTGTGLLSTAVAGTDFLSPTGSGTGLSGVGLTASSLAQFAATTSTELRTLISDETGNGGGVVFANNATLTSPTIAKLGGVTTNGFLKTSAGDGTLVVDTNTYLADTTYSNPSFITSLAWSKISLSNTDVIMFGSRGIISSPADGNFKFTTNAGNAGFVLDGGDTDALLWIKDRSLADAAEARANTLTAQTSARFGKTSTYDGILIAPVAKGAGQFDGTLTSADLTGARTWTMPDETGTFALVANVQPLDTDLTAIAALTTTTYGRSLLTLADASAGRTSLGLVIGTDVQAQSSVLNTFISNGSAYYLSRANHTGTQAWSTLTGTPTTVSGYGITDAFSASAAQTVTVSGAASTPVWKFTGNLYSGGTNSTTHPFLYWDGSQCSGGAATAPTGSTNGFNTNGAYVGINVCTSSVYNAVSLLKVWANGTRRFEITGDRLAWYNPGDGIGAYSIIFDYNNGYFYSDRNFYTKADAGNFTGFITAGSGEKTGFRFEAIGQLRGWNCASPSSCSSTVQLVHADLPTAGGNSGTGTKTLTLNTSNYWSYTVTGAFTLAFSNPTAGQTFTIVLTIDGTGGYGQPTWPTMKWDGGSAPTLNMAANKVNVIVVTYDGTNYIGKATVIGG